MAQLIVWGISGKLLFVAIINLIDAIFFFCVFCSSRAITEALSTLPPLFTETYGAAGLWCWVTTSASPHEPLDVGESRCLLSLVKGFLLIFSK